MTKLSDQHNPSTTAELRAAVERLQAVVWQLEQERLELYQQRRRRMIFVAVSLSILFHIALLIYFGRLPMPGSAGGSVAEVTYEFAILNEEQLSLLEPTEFDDLAGEEAVLEEPDSPPDAAELNPAVTSADLAVAASSAVPSLGGGVGDGLGDGMGLGGGSGGTSFFGISSRGTRFAYIVDISGSMASNRRMEVAMRELSRSIDSLPDFAYFHVLMFSNSYIEPPMQKGWMRAKKSTVRQYIRWFNSLSPDGGTLPAAAFHHVFSLEVRPDVIFFLTDGEINEFTPQDLAALNRRGKKVVVNTIAFGDPASQEALKQMARESGGTYRFVPSGGNYP